MGPISYGNMFKSFLQTKPTTPWWPCNIEHDHLNLTATLLNLMSLPGFRLNKEVIPQGCLWLPLQHIVLSCPIYWEHNTGEEPLQVKQHWQPRSRRLPARTVVILPCTALFKHALNLGCKHLLVSLTHLDTKLERAMRAANLSSVSFYVWVISPYSLEGHEC